MSPSVKRKLTAGVAAASVAAFGGVAYAASRGSDKSFRDAYLNDVAGRLHVSPAQLKSALKGAFLDQLNAAVKAGRLTQAQADELRKRLESGGLPMPGPGFGFRERHRFFFEGPGLHREHGGLDAAASYLGLTDLQLFNQLRSGKSLAQVAKDRGKSVAGLKAAMLAEIKARLDRAVSKGRLTKTEAQDILSRISSNLDAQISGKLPKFGPPGPPRWRPGAFALPGGTAVPPPPPGPFA